MDDLKRLGEGFQAKYLQTKAQLEATLTKLALTENELANTQQARDDLVQRCEEISTKAANDIAELQSASRQQLADLEARHAEEMSRYRSETERSLEERDSLIALNSEKVRNASDNPCAADAQAVVLHATQVRSLEVDLAEAMRQCRKLDREKKNLQAECDRARADMITAENSNSRGTNYAEFSREYQSLLQELAHYKQLAAGAATTAPTGSAAAAAAGVVGVDAAAAADIATATSRPTRSRTTLSSSSLLAREETAATGARSGPQRVLRGAIRTQSAAANT